MASCESMIDRAVESLAHLSAAETTTHRFGRKHKGRKASCSLDAHYFARALTKNLQATAFGDTLHRIRPNLAVYRISASISETQSPRSYSFEVLRVRCKI
ncbi:hypothetical protein PAXRUDRAFT_823348 [Paxillus rubicundulus Ve08.2h10]|uniref:Uncharacterized protein n=1 Tax=Paxillus rubicundulus Ve08.2h10 TaxID=930991 RepID=A0A0D0E8Y5_9AGAM|nr:hypothetical protein PAXRUDRAFT_823348 [Paxillus rubicundulus Ve08.2h10]